METSVASFKIGIAAFVVPFMFFYNSALLMDAVWFKIVQASLTAIFGVFLLSSGVQGWFMGRIAPWVVRIVLIAAALFMIEGGLLSDGIGILLALAAFLIQRNARKGSSEPVAAGR